MLVCIVFFMFLETNLKQIRSTDVLQGVVLDGSNQCFLFCFLLNEVRGFFSLFNIKLIFLILCLFGRKEATSFMWTGRCEGLHSFQLWLMSPL